MQDEQSPTSQAKPASSTLDSTAPAAKLPEARPARTKGVKRARLSPQLKTAIEVMAYEGLSLPLAAERANMNVQSLKHAFRKTHVKQSYNQLVTEIRSGAAVLAYARINRLGEVAASETVKLEANKWIAGVDNIAPVKRVEGRVAITHTFGGFEFPDMGTVDHAPLDSPSGDDDS